MLAFTFGAARELEKHASHSSRNNVKSKNGAPELVSMLQFLSETRIDNPEIRVKDPRILELNDIVTEVKSSEEWEAVKVNILEIGIEKGRERRKY